MDTQTMTTPRFRTDLVTQPIETAGQRFVDVTDPDSGTTFRFYEVEYAIACAMNGSRDLNGLASWALEELGLETSSDELETVINTLGELGYLESGAEGTGEVALGAPGGRPPVEATAAPIQADDLELGAPGKSPIARQRPAAPPADDIALGAPGQAAGGEAASAEESFEGLLDDEPPTTVRPAPTAPSMDDEPTRRREAVREMDFGDLEGLTPPPAEVPTPKLRPVTSPASDDDGPTNLPPPAPGLEEMPEVSADVSVDLSEHLSIDAADVKEAVRQSQVMQAVDVPDELLAEIGQEAEKPAAAPESAAPVVLPDERAQVSRPVATPAEEAEEALPPPAKKTGSGGLLFLVFLLLVVGAGAAYYFLIYKPKQDKAAAQAGNTRPVPSTPTLPPKPVPPPKPSATLEAAAGEPTQVVMPAAGALSWMPDDGATVAKGDPIGKLKGIERYEKKLAEYQSRQEHYQRKLDKANEELAAAKDDAAKASAQRHIDAATHKVEQKKQGEADMKAKIAALTLIAPVAGTIKQDAHLGAWLKQGAPVVEITGTPGVKATFTLPRGRTLVVGDKVKIAPKADEASAVECEVESADASQATVRCDASDSLAAGAQVELLP